MKKLYVLFALVLAVSAGHAALPQPDLIASLHFAGSQNISTDPSYLPFADEFSCPQAGALAVQTLDKLSHAPYGWFRAKLPANAGDGSALLRPLLNDLLSSEWKFEARDMATGSPEYVLAIRLSPGRDQIWKNNLRQLLEAWTKIPTRAVAGGWELKKDLPPNLIRVTENNGWLLVDCGQNQLTLGETVLQTLTHEPVFSGNAISGEKAWLAADVNWPRLGQWFDDIKALNLPETRFKVMTKSANLRVDGKFLFPENLPLNLPAWQIPASEIREPIVGFTAVRGFSTWLNSQAWMRPYQISPAPDQLFVWALPRIPFQTYLALPVPNSKQALQQSYSRLNPAINSANSRNEFFSSVKMATTNAEIHFQGIPFAAPFIKSLHDPAGQFLVAGAFLDDPGTKPLPPELFQNLAKPDLVFYHWEITAERFPQLLQLTQLGLVMAQCRQLGTDSAALKWLRKITPHLGNTATEITKTGPSEMTFTRSAPGGLTAFEFLALGNWLEANNFPGYDLKLPPGSDAR